MPFTLSNIIAPWKKIRLEKKRAAPAHWSIVFHFLASEQFQSSSESVHNY